jgi:hypothetical protein
MPNYLFISEIVVMNKAKALFKSAPVRAKTAPLQIPCHAIGYCRWLGCLVKSGKVKPRELIL